MGRIVGTVFAVVVFLVSMPGIAANAQTGPTGPSGTGPTGPCVWEWGGTPEATPTPCPASEPSPVEVTGSITATDDEGNALLTLGLGLLVFLSAISLVYSWSQRRRG